VIRATRLGGGTTDPEVLAVADGVATGTTDLRLPLR